MEDVRIKAAIAAGNINVVQNESEILDLSETSKRSQEQHAVLLRRVEAERRARNLVVPTSIKEVCHYLRQLHFPITLFGENASDRRERLRGLLSKMQLNDRAPTLFTPLQGVSEEMASTSIGSGAAMNVNHKSKQDELFYTPASSSSLKNAKSIFATMSLQKSTERLARQRQQTQEMHEAEDVLAGKLYTSLKHINIQASQIGHARPVSMVRYSPDGTRILTGSWSGLLKVWDAKSCQLEMEVKECEDRITGIDWHQNSKHFLSGAADGVAHVWSIEQPTVPIATLTGHTDRCGKVAMHPTGQHALTSSFDHTWRLWDIERSTELLLQEGHYRPIVALAVHSDGNVVATGDIGGIARMWDLRSGKGILTLQGHSKQVLALDFSTGHIIASGSGDHTVRIWDMRKQSCVYVIPAHQNLISDLSFSKSSEVLVTSSYDNSLRIWNTRDFKLMKELKGHEGRVMSVDISDDERSIVSSGYDRTFKVWAKDDDDAF